MPFGSVLSALQYPVATQSAFGLGVKFPMGGYFGMGFGNCPVFRAFRRKPIAFPPEALVRLQDSNILDKELIKNDILSDHENMAPNLAPSRRLCDDFFI